MNIPAARRSLNSAKVLRDCARWLEQRGATKSAAVCRVQMRIAAKAMVNFLAPSPPRAECLQTLITTAA